MENDIVGNKTKLYIKKPTCIEKCKQRQIIIIIFFSEGGRLFSCHPIIIIHSLLYDTLRTKRNMFAFRKIMCKITHKIVRNKHKLYMRVNLLI